MLANARKTIRYPYCEHWDIRCYLSFLSVEGAIAFKVVLFELLFAER